jgi:hypothetical protein
MTTLSELSVLDQFFGTGGYPLPHISVPVEEGLKWANAHRAWARLRQMYNERATIMRSMEREILTQREATVANHMMFYEESQLRRYRCRRRLQPIARLLLKEASDGNQVH